jgi:HEAT repeat protein
VKKTDFLIAFLTFILCLQASSSASAQTLEANEQALVNAQIERLKSSDVETRRDAVHQLFLLENAVAARAAAATALRDKSEIVRATAAKTCAFLPGEEAANFLSQILTRDKSEFVRRETAFALGNAHSEAAVTNLIQSLRNDKKASVRAAAAIALGQIADERAVAPLSQVLLAMRKKKKKDATEVEFLRRSAARALGETRFKSAAPALIIALQNANNADDVRREAAYALGIIADKSAVDVLTENLKNPDYLLMEIAKNALQRIQNSEVISIKNGW